jgi:hypothetical protein
MRTALWCYDVASPAQQQRTNSSQRKKKTYVSGTHDATNLLHGVEIGTQASVHGEDLLINDGSNGQAVEAISKSLP